MEIHQVLRPSHPHVEVTGAHQLSWNVMLDAVFADASQAGVASMTVSLAHQDVLTWAHLRADVTPAQGDRRAILCQSFDMMLDPTYTIAYTVEHGGVLGGAIQRRNHLSDHTWVARQQCWVYTWKSRLMGIPIRLANAARRPDLVDRYMREMRAQMVSRKSTVSYYHLTVWERGVAQL